MAIKTQKKMEIYGTISGANNTIAYGYEAASQSFEENQFVYFSGGKLTACADDASAIAGVSAEPATGTTDTVIGFYPITDLKLSMCVYHGTPASAITAVTQVGNCYNLEVDSEKMYVDIENTSAQSCQVIGFHPDDDVGDRYGRVIVTILGSVDQLKTTPTTVGGSTITMTTTGKLQFRDSAIYVNSPSDGQMDIVADTEVQIDTTTLDINAAVDISGAVGFTGATTYATTAKAQFRDTGLYINSGADGKMTISSDGVGTDDITISGTVTLDDDLITPTTKKVQFRDAAIYLNSSVDGQLDIVADTEVQIATTTVDLNGALDVSGTTALGDSATFATDKSAIFRAATQAINSSAANTLDIISGTTMNIAANAVAQAVTIGNVTGASALNLKCGTGNFDLQGVAASTYNFGKSDQTGTLTFFTSTGAQTANLFNGNGVKTIAMATGTGGNTFNLLTGAGTNALNICTANEVQTIHIGDHATPANVIKIGGGASGTVIGGTLNYGAGATKNDMTTTISGAVAVDGQVLIIVPAATSDGNCTLALNGGAAKKVLEQDGTTQVGSGKLVANTPAILVYNSALDAASGAWVAVGIT